MVKANSIQIMAWSNTPERKEGDEIEERNTVDWKCGCLSGGGHKSLVSPEPAETPHNSPGAEVERLQLKAHCQTNN